MTSKSEFMSRDIFRMTSTMGHLLFICISKKKAYMIRVSSGDKKQRYKKV